MAVTGFGAFLRAVRWVAENPEEDHVRPSSRYLPGPEPDFWGEDQPASPAVLGEDDQRP